MEEEIKKCLKNLRIEADFEDRPNSKRLVITLMLGKDVISETKLYI
jgi:hypothetical protein